MGIGRESPYSFKRGAEDINDRGQIVGRTGWEAFFWDKGVVTDLPALPHDCMDPEAGAFVVRELMGHPWPLAPTTAVEEAPRLP